jgi:hypothetical protein
MSTAGTFSLIELQAACARHEIHLRNALAALARAKPEDRYRHGGSCERATSRWARKVERHSRNLAKTREKLAAAEAL